MRATGIVRRIDDLGRVVIPKEIRRTMRIREGDPLEIYTEKDGEVIFKKYSPVGELAEIAVQICETMSKTALCPAVITDRDSVIAVSGAPKRDLLDKRVSPELEQIMEERHIYRKSPDGQSISLLEGSDRYSACIAAPIITEGDLMGCVVFLTPEEGTQPGEVHFKLAQTVAGFLGKQLES